MREGRQRSSGSIYSYEPYVFGLMLLASVVAVPAGWFLRKKSGRVGGFGWVMLIGGPIMLVAVVPGFWSDFIKVDEQGFELKTGFWFAPTHYKVEFDKLSSIALTAETRTGRRGRKETSYFLQCAERAAAGDKVPVGDMMKVALDEILTRAHDKGVVLMDQTNGQ
ncbi:MAG TPA: hypothetical protein VGJ26_11890 [Pirellulales bacterium]